MKIKKEVVEKIILGILTFILIMYISFGLIFFSLFHVSKKFLNKENVHDFVSNIDITSLLKDELGNELKEFTLIKEDLNDIGISTEGINEFINSKDVKEFSTDVVINVFNKATNKSNIDYKITNNQLNELVESNINKLAINSSTKGQQILNKIESKIPNLVSNINELLDEFCNKLENSDVFQKYQNYIYKSINILDIIYSEFVTSTIIFAIFSFITLLIFIRRNIYKTLKWLSISFIIPTIVFSMISTIISTYVNIDNILISNVLNIVNRDLIKHSSIYFVISFIFVIINLIMYIVKKYRRKKKVSYE